MAKVREDTTKTEAWPPGVKVLWEEVRVQQEALQECISQAKHEFESLGGSISWPYKEDRSRGANRGRTPGAKSNSHGSRRMEIVGLLQRGLRGKRERVAAPDNGKSRGRSLNSGRWSLPVPEDIVGAPQVLW